MGREPITIHQSPERSMSSKLEIFEIHDPEVWDAFVRTSPQGTVFATSAWLEAAGEALGGTPVRFGCFRGGDLVGGCGLLRIQKMGLKKATTPMLTPYSGFLFAPPSAKRAAQEEGKRNTIASQLIERLEKDFHYGFLRHPPALHDVRPFRWAGWSVEVRYTYVVSLEDMEAAWGNCEHSIRKQINKAEKRDIKIMKSGHIDSFLELQDRSFARQKIASPLARDRMRQFYEQLSARDLCRLYVAEDASNRPLSARIVVPGFDTVYDWIAGADPDYYAIGATPLLVWTIMKEMSESHSTFDFSGANLPSVSKFKRGFGGELRSYYVAEKYSSMISKALIKGHLMLKGRRA